MAIPLDDLKPIDPTENGWIKNPGDFWRNGPSGPPLVADPAGTLEFDGTPKLVQYTRPSKFGSLIFDHDAVERWDLREVAINGLTQATTHDRDLVKRILAHGSMPAKDKKFKRWKTEGDNLVAALRKHAKAQIAAERGTHAHALVEDDSLERSWLARAADGEDLGITVEMQAGIVAAWQQCIADHDIEILANEITVVNDQLKAAGSGDVVARNRRDLIFVMPDGSTRTIPAGTIFILDIKGLALDTPLPTPTGWTSMGEVQVGDTLLGSDGKPCQVLYKSPIHNKPTYRLTFADGTTVVADEDHQWVVDVGVGKLNIKRRVLTTAEIASSMFGYANQRQHRIPNPEPLHLPDADLPLDPYVLGAWLGDGKHTSSEITGLPDSGVWKEILRRGFRLGKPQAKQGTTAVSQSVLGIRKHFTSLGLLGNKHIPPAYLRGSVQQRLDLLRGLMDTDGTVNKPKKSVQLTTTDPEMARSVLELLVSLGERGHISKVTRRGFGTSTVAHDVVWTPALFNPFTDARKVARCEQFIRSTGRNTHRIIVGCEPAESVPTQCIGVDSPDSTYLCTDSMLVTHNSGKWKMINGYPHYAQAYATQLAIYAGARPYDVDTETRLDWPWPIDQTHAIIGHLDVLGAMEGKPACTLHYIDLAIGRAACDLVVAAMHFADRKDVYSIGEVVDGRVVLAEGGRMLSGAAKVVAPDVINRIAEGSGVPRFPVLQDDVTATATTATEEPGKISDDSSGSFSGALLQGDVNATTTESAATVEPSLFDQTAPPNTPASAATTESDSDRAGRRQALRDRCRNVYTADPAKGKQIIAEWPTDVPPLNGDHPHSSSELDLIQALCDRVSPPTAPAPAASATPEPAAVAPAAVAAEPVAPALAAAPVDQVARRAELRKRCLDILAENPAAGKRLIAEWPSGIPPLSGNHQHTAAELDQIEALCNTVTGTRPNPDGDKTAIPTGETTGEPRNGLRLSDGDGDGQSSEPVGATSAQAHLTAVPDSPDTPSIDPGLYVPDEGDSGPHLAEKFAKIESDYATMSRTNQKWMGRLLREARQHGVSFATREEGMPETERLYTQRRFELLGGLIHLAVAGGVDDESVRALVALATDNEQVLTTTTPTGAVIGALDAAEAGRLAQLISALDEGTVLPICEDGVPMRFIRSA